jgi:alanine racemase
MIPSFSRPTRALLSRQALIHNLRILKAKSGRARVQAVLKADAYGHGAAVLGPWLEKAGVRSFGLATLEEALELRRAGLNSELMILGAVDERYLKQAAAAKVGITAWSRLYLETAARLGRPLDVHLKVDTGMTRLGFEPREVPGILADFEAGRFGRLRLASAYTHFACADEARDSQSMKQLALFKSLPWPKGLRLHAANSSAALRYPQARLDMVRSGLFLYGAMGPSKPVLSLSTRILRVASGARGQGVSYGHTFKAARPMRVATVAAGYADGLPRLLSNRAHVLIQGRRCKILGRVCMDLSMVDVSGLNAKPGDEAMLLGSQGRESVTANDWASLSQTNAYEILCGISQRVPREFHP